MPWCSQCGNQIFEGSRFCASCGMNISTGENGVAMDSPQWDQANGHADRTSTVGPAALIMPRHGHKRTIIGLSISLIILLGAFGTYYAVKTNGGWSSTLSSSESSKPQSTSTNTVTAQTRVGDVVKFGNYEQDNDLTNGPEPIAWKVLAVEGNKALLLSEKGLDCKGYNETITDVTWETCTLRKWLNNDFSNTAFSSSEQDLIATSVQQNPNNPKYGTEGGNDTRDKVFLLSGNEVEKYFPSYEARQVKPTPYAVDEGLHDYNGWCNWWLRSIGKTNCHAERVQPEGWGDVSGVVIGGSCAVRPALWINL